MNLYTEKSIRTFTGKQVNIFEPKKSMFCIEDIAHALSKEQRFGNHLKKHYSVAQHCLICAELAPAEHKFTALMHDCSEAYLRDLPTPIKEEIPEYKKIENNLMLVLADKFGFEYPLPEKIKEIDAMMMEKEWNALMLDNQKFDWVIMNAKTVNMKFLRAYNQLSEIL